MLRQDQFVAAAVSLCHHLASYVQTREDLLVLDDVNAQGYDLPSQVAIDMILDYPIDHD